MLWTAEQYKWILRENIHYYLETLFLIVQKKTKIVGMSITQYLNSTKDFGLHLETKKRSTNRAPSNELPKTCDSGKDSKDTVMSVLIIIEFENFI